MTDAPSVDSIAARKRFEQILASIPNPLPNIPSPKTGPPPTDPAHPDLERALRFKKRDLDGDGSLSLEEFIKTMSGTDRKAAETRFRSMDKNRDASLSPEEFGVPASLPPRP